MVAGGSTARVLDLTGAEIKDIQTEAVALPIGQSVHSVAWSPDGQLLTVSTTVSDTPWVCWPRLSALFVMYGCIML